MKAEPQVRTKIAVPSMTPIPGGLLQRKCACGGTPGADGECAECQKKRLSVQRSASGPSKPSTVPPIVHEVLRSPGQPLDEKALDFMESRFGHDFSRVRVHTDSQAAESARMVGALAYTVAQDVVFAAGQYGSTDARRRELLAHELAHVVQQTGSGDFEASPKRELEVGPADHPLEQHADAAAESALRGTTGLPSGSGEVGGVLLQRQMAVPTYRVTPTPTPRLLSKKTISGPTSDNCGVFSWTIQWLLSQPSGPKGGYVIQTLKIAADTKDCGSGCDGAVEPKKLLYWFQEAWPIDQNQKVTILVETGMHADDEYSQANPRPGMCGSVVYEATAAYFDDIKLPNDFVTSNPKTVASDLRSTTTIHNFEGGTPEVPHNLEAKWKCCPKEEKTKLMAS